MNKNRIMLLVMILCVILVGSASAQIASRNFTDTFDGSSGDQMCNWNAWGGSDYTGTGQYAIPVNGGIERMIEYGAFTAQVDITGIDPATSGNVVYDVFRLDDNYTTLQCQVWNDGGQNVYLTIYNQKSDGSWDEMVQNLGATTTVTYRYAWDPVANTLNVWAGLDGSSLVQYLTDYVCHGMGTGAIIEKFYSCDNGSSGSAGFEMDNYRITIQVQASASNPTPGDQAIVPDGDEIALSWDTGFDAYSHNIYFGKNLDAVTVADPTFLLGDLDEDGQLSISDILILCDVWLQDPIGQQPSPDLNGDNTVNLEDLSLLALNWQKQSAFKGNQTAASYDLLALTPDYYYWRVDEVDGAGNVTEGPVWSFNLKSCPENIDLASQWRFKIDLNNTGVANLWYSSSYDDSNWNLLNVPGDWDSQGYSWYNGIAWYRKLIFIPEEWDGLPCDLVLGGVDDEYDVYVNGQHAGHYGIDGQSVYLTTTITEIASYINTNSYNLIAIRVNDWGGGGGIVQAPTILMAISTDYLSLEDFFARTNLTGEEQALKDVIYDEDNVPIWWENSGSQGGFIPPPRIFGFVMDDEYCQQNISVLKNNVDHSNPKVRVAVALRLAELKGAEGFEVLLDALKAETVESARGSNKWLFQYPRIADRLIAMIGHPDGYDPAGTQALRDAVIEKWRDRWHSEGESWLRGLQKAKNYSPVAGIQKLELQGSIVKTLPMTDMETLFALASSKITEFAAMDGRFPPAGMLLGDNAGIWAGPIKVMNGFKFNIKETGYEDWELFDCQEFIQKFHSCEFHFAQNELSITRTDFAVENEHALFSVLTLNNDTGQARTINVEFTGLVNIRPCWDSTYSNDLDIVSYDGANSLVQAYDSGASNNWATVFGSDQTPANCTVLDNSGTLTYSVNVPANGSSEIAFLMVGEHSSGVTAAVQKYNSLISQRSALKTQRENAYQEKLFDNFCFTCSAPNITNTFASAKATLLAMTDDAQPCMPGKVYLSGWGSYPNLYPADASYSVHGAAAGGLWNDAKSCLRTIAYHTLQKGGRVPHSVTKDGTYRPCDGFSHETQVFIVACGKYFDWSGDEQFVTDYYNQFKQSINWVLNNIDTDGDHYPSGNSWIEANDVDGENIDSACYLYKAFDVMANFADSLGYPSDASLYSSYATSLKARFNTDFWNSSLQKWAFGLTSSGQQMANWWTINIPQEVCLADPDKARAVIDDQKDDVWYSYKSIVSKGAYNYGEYEAGWDWLIKGSEIALNNLMLGGFEDSFPAAYDGPFAPGAGRYIDAVVEGLCGIAPDAINHKVEIFPQPPAELDDFSLTNFYVGQHKLDLSWVREPGGDIEITVLHEQGPSDIEVLIRVRSEAGQTIKRNGSIIAPAEEVIRGITTKIIPVSLMVSQDVVLRLEY